MRALCTLLSLSLAAASPCAQSISGSASAGSDLVATSFDPGLPFVEVMTTAGTALPDGFELRASQIFGSSFGATRVSVAQDPVLFTIREATFAQPSGGGFGSATTGPHDILLSLAVTRDYSGDVIVHWNGIEQNDGLGSLSCQVDVGNDGSIEFLAAAGTVRTQRFTRSWTPAAPLVISCRTSSTSNGAIFSSYKSVLEIEFEPDSATVAPSAYRTYGFGCGGSNGFAPLLSAAAGPLVGETFTSEIRLVPATSPGGFGALGFVETPPFHLDVVGMDFCFLFLEPVISFPLAPPAFGTDIMSWDLAIPNRTDLVGSVILQQAFVLDAGANPLGATVTNAGRATVGGN